MRLWAKASLATVAAMVMATIASPSASPTPPSATVPLPPLQLSGATGWVVRDTGVAELRVRYRCASGVVAGISPRLQQTGDEMASFGMTSQAVTCDGASRSVLFTFLGFYEYQAFYRGRATYEIDTGVLPQGCDDSSSPSCESTFKAYTGVVDLQPTRRLRQRLVPTVGPTTGTARLMRRATVNEETGSAETVVAYTCPRGSEAAFFFVRLQQAIGRAPLTQVDEGGPLTCDGSTHRARVRTRAELGRFAEGRAVATVGFVDSNGEGIGWPAALRQVRLKNVQHASSMAPRP